MDGGAIQEPVETAEVRSRLVEGLLREASQVQYLKRRLRLLKIQLRKKRERRTLLGITGFVFMLLGAGAHFPGTHRYVAVILIPLACLASGATFAYLRFRENLKSWLVWLVTALVLVPFAGFAVAAYYASSHDQDAYTLWGIAALSLAFAFAGTPASFSIFLNSLPRVSPATPAEPGVDVDEILAKLRHDFVSKSPVDDELGRIQFALLDLVQPEFDADEILALSRSDLIDEIRDTEDRLDLASSPKESQRAERLFKLHQSELRKYYEQALHHSGRIFALGILAIIAGLGMAGTTLYLLNHLAHTSTSKQIVIAGIGGVSSLLSNFVAVVYLRMFSETTHSLTKFHNTLVTTHHAHFGNFMSAKIQDQTLRENTWAMIAETLAGSTARAAIEPVPTSKNGSAGSSQAAAQVNQPSTPTEASSVSGPATTI